jgi:hypothetical protein
MRRFYGVVVVAPSAPDFAVWGHYGARQPMSAGPFGAGGGSP